MVYASLSIMEVVIREEMVQVTILPDVCMGSGIFLLVFLRLYALFHPMMAFLLDPFSFLH